MAIIGSGSKASRDITYSGSSTDDDLPVRQKQRVSKLSSFVESDVSDETEFSERGTELCQVGDETCAVPLELFDLSDLKKILSLDTWNFCLTDDERLFLVSYLPAFDADDFRTTIRELLGGNDFHFSSPLADLFDRLRGGLCAPQVARYHEGLKYVQRKKHYHLLRNYHNQMVTSFLDMQKSWEDCPQSADIDERLDVWTSWKAQKSLPQVSKRRGGTVRKSRVAINVGQKMNVIVQKPIITEERRVESIPVPAAVIPFFPRTGSKGVLKMKVIAPKADMAGGSASKGAPDVEPERVKLPAPKGVLKVARKGLLQGLPKAEKKVREKVVVEELKRESGPREVQPVKIVRPPKGPKEESTDRSRNLPNPKSEKKKSSSERKRKQMLEDEDNFALEMGEAQTSYVAESPQQEVRKIKKVKAFKEVQARVEEKDVEEEKKILIAKKKARRKKMNDEKKKASEVLDVEHFETVDDRRIVSARQEDTDNEQELAEFRDDEVQKIPKKRSKKKAKEPKGESSPLESTPDSPGERGASVKSSKKLSPLSVPSIASTFSFSITHLLSAVRMALTLPSGDVTSEFHNQNGAVESFSFEKALLGSSIDLSLEHSDQSPGVFVDGASHLVEGTDLEGKRSSSETCSGVFGDDLSHSVGVSDHGIDRRGQAVSFAEIVVRVQGNPGDPRILEIHEPLHNLVRGALKVFSSRTAPPGAKGWKPLAHFDKESRTWSWIGPISSSCSLQGQHELLVTPEAWGVPQKTLAKMEEAFAIWLKHGQETFQQIVQLPLPPPPPNLIPFDEKERFRDLRAQKSLMTITASSDDMRAYFRREEVLRYSLPDRAFPYTTADGRKSVVAPLRRGGGKLTSKARDHFMLKPDRPPHVTILCLVRDAAARLPGSIGTRVDVCTLIRDSQYIVEDVSDVQVNQVVSGALDRLHYERDPCVKFDGERKLWMYLHTDRQEEDFEDDGTSSTKRWKKPRKEIAENGELELLGYDNGSPSGADHEGYGSGLGMEMNSPDDMGDPGSPSAIYSVGSTELVYSKSGSLSSPRVLVSVMGSSIREESLPALELPPSLHPGCVDSHNTCPVVWGRVGPTAAWVPDHHHLHSHEPLGEEDYDAEAAAAAQRDAEAMIDTDTN